MNPENPLFIEYQKTIPEKLKTIKEHLSILKKTRTLENLKQLRFDIHKLAGSAGTYGFSQASHLCKTLDEDLSKKMEAFNQSNLTEKWFSSLDDFLSDLKRALAAPDQDIQK